MAFINTVTYLFCSHNVTGNNRLKNIFLKHSGIAKCFCCNSSIFHFCWNYVIKQLWMQLVRVTLRSLFWGHSLILFENMCASVSPITLWKEFLMFHWRISILSYHVITQLLEYWSCSKVDESREVDLRSRL